MNIDIYLVSKSSAKDLIVQLLESEFFLHKNHAELLYTQLIQKHFDKLKSSIYLLAETNYVDKVYRDSYYHYYSSKLNNYKRNCIRISLFEGEIVSEDFHKAEKYKELQEKYRGFLVIRPTAPHVIGRSIISPKALVQNNIRTCLTTFDATANNLKFTVSAFPHSSQDTETISCAETTLWAIMEYFSNKYSNYTPVLPSKIMQTLQKMATERQVPSKGLNITQMSFALKEFGFGTRIYSRQEYRNEFENILSCYIESGIPLIIAMDNRPNGNIGHALLAIGHEEIDDSKIDTIIPYQSNDNLNALLNQKNIQLYDYSSIKKRFVFIDDNTPVYQTATLGSPAAHYSVDWHNCKITYFVAPLYPKIYLEAFEAKNYTHQFLLNGPSPLADNTEVLLRFYLASSRSFKNFVSLNSSMTDDFKGIILETSMPKFVWIAELSTKQLMKNEKANGMVILDATEANIYFNKPLIMAAYQGKLVSLDKKTGKLEIASLPLNVFTVYTENLKTS